MGRNVNCTNVNLPQTAEADRRMLYTVQSFGLKIDTAYQGDVFERLTTLSFNGQNQGGMLMSATGLYWYLAIQLISILTVSTKP